MTKDISVDQLAGVYIKIRDAKATLTREYEEQKSRLEEQQNQVKQALLQYCKNEKLESFRTSHGTVTRKVNTRYWTNDWPSMFEFVLEHKVPEFFEKRLNQTHVKQFLDEHSDVVPPGLNADSSYNISVTKPRKPRSKQAAE
jgi:hypothetical protein